MTTATGDMVKRRLAQAQFFMLRYETELTPCTGITAVSRQERRAFNRGVMIAPWCPKLTRKGPKDDPLVDGRVQDLGWDALDVNGLACRVLATTDGDLPPIVYLDVAGRFQGVETPYDVPLSTLRKDTLYFGIAVNEFLKRYGCPQQFVWGADWESVPALTLLRKRHHISLTLHNTFDECLEQEAQAFGDTFRPLTEKRPGGDGGYKTALEVGLEIADVATTVNRGFAYGMRNEPVQSLVMAKHLQHQLGKVVGINNAAFSPLRPELRELKNLLASDPVAGGKELLGLKKKALEGLPKTIREKAKGKVIVVSMGRRVAQKLHDVFVESVRQLLQQDRDFPLLAVFATVHGDEGSDARLGRMKELQDEFPENVACEENRIPYYQELMAAADYNCMPSLYEPHGGAFEGTVVPIARAVDGLVEQICGLEPEGRAKEMNALWHAENEAPTGFLFREQLAGDEATLTAELAALLKESPSPDNGIFRAMRDALSEVLQRAVTLRVDEPDAYVRLVQGALEQQEGTSWLINLGGMLALVEQARSIRRIV